MGGAGGVAIGQLGALGNGDGPGSEFARALAERLEAAGRGAASRGPGYAALQFSGESPDLSDQFDVEALPPGGLPDLDRSYTVGVTRGDPTVDPVRQGAAVTEFGSDGAQSSWRRRLAPKHRAAVGRFFKSDDE